eukprot:759822-Hanusia_phi.AAC.2
MGRSFDQAYLSRNKAGGLAMLPNGYRYSLTPAGPAAGHVVHHPHATADPQASVKPLHEFTPDDIAAVGYDPRSVIGSSAPGSPGSDSAHNIQTNLA